MRTLIFKNKIIKELIKANQDGWKNITYSKNEAKEFAEKLVSNIKQGRKK